MRDTVKALLIAGVILVVVIVGGTVVKNHSGSDQPSVSADSDIGGWSGEPARTSVPSGPAEVVQKCVECIKSGDTTSAEEYFTKESCEKFYFFGAPPGTKSALAVLAKLVEWDVSIDYAQASVSGKTARIRANLSKPDDFNGRPTVERFVIVLADRGDGWKIDDIGLPW